MSLQLSISFEVTHKRENNPLSEEHLNAHRDKFSKGCFKVLMKLVNGERLTVKGAVLNGLSNSLPRRLKDLKAFGIYISDEWDADRTFKTWFMTSDDKAKSLTVLLGKTTVKKVA